MSKVTSEQQAAWSEIVTKKYADQAVWFLNGFWDELEAHAEDVWKWVELFGQLDQDKKAEGCELDEFWSHKFLESLGETMTVIEMREKFRTIDVDFNKRMSLIEFLAFRFKKSIQEVIDAPQGGNQEEINKAQAAVEAAQKAVDEMVARLAEATRKAEESAAAAAEAKAKSEAANAAAEEAIASPRLLMLLLKKPLVRLRLPDRPLTRLLVLPMLLLLLMRLLPRRRLNLMLRLLRLRLLLMLLKPLLLLIVLLLLRTRRLLKNFMLRKRLTMTRRPSSRRPRMIPASVS